MPQQALVKEQCFKKEEAAEMYQQLLFLGEDHLFPDLPGFSINLFL
jgi:hypothetical protein